MGANSSIEWTDHTHNPWYGCSKVSPGCANCYAEGWAKRSGLVTWGGPRRRASAAKLMEPMKWNELYERQSDVLTPGMARIDHPLPRPRVFCGSLMDWLDHEVPVAWLADLLGMIHRCPNLDFQLLTKRPELWVDRIYKAGGAALHTPENYHQDYWTARKWLDGEPPPNVWIGATIENQAMADERIPELLKIPAKVRFLSCEPLLGPIDFRVALPCGDCGERDEDTGYGCRNGNRCDDARWIRKAGLLWLIVGGESGKHRRPMELEWMGGIIDQCQAAGVPVFVKQDNGPWPGMQGRIPDEWWAMKEFPR